MGANAQTTVPSFLASQVLTADQMNQSARTGVPVFAGTTERDAAFGGAGEKTLAEGQLCYLESTNVVQYYDGSVWATVGPASAGGLVLVKAETIGSGVSSVAVTSAFSSTYDNYLIQIAGGVASTAVNLGLQLGATTTGYYAAYPRLVYSTAATANVADNNATIFSRVGSGNTNTLNLNCTVVNPNLAKHTFFYGHYVDADTTSVAGAGAGYVNNSTQYTDFTIVPNTGTLTGGTIRVYGYANS
jgi:hypothetical protein